MDLSLPSFLPVDGVVPPVLFLCSPETVRHRSPRLSSVVVCSASSWSLTLRTGSLPPGSATSPQARWFMFLLGHSGKFQISKFKIFSCVCASLRDNLAGRLIDQWSARCQTFCLMGFLALWFQFLETPRMYIAIHGWKVKKKRTKLTALMC